MHVIGNGSPLKPWLKNDLGISTIKFCYADEYTKNKVKLIFAEA
jgi:hypothetical protein